MTKNGKPKSHKAQHFVAQCYMKPWIDRAPSSGPTVTPYVWVFDRDGGNARKKAPSNLFTETDLYTIELPDGTRDLRLEHGLQELEDKYTRVRNLALARRVLPNAEQMPWLVAFVATAQFRTVAVRDHWAEQWGRVRQLGEDMQERFDSATSEERKLMARASLPSSNRGAPLDLDHVRRLEAQPIQMMIGQLVRTVQPILSRMSMAVLCTEDQLGFVTTDNPCVWVDPESYKYPPYLRGPGIGMKGIEITLPVSPSQCLVFTHRPEFEGFFDVDERVVADVNRRPVAHCDQNFIACRNEVRQAWFEQPPLPDDAWEKVRERELGEDEPPEP